MGPEIVVFVAVYLVIGYWWEWFFHSVVLEGKDWIDHKYDVGSAIFVTLAWPGMALITGAFAVIVYMPDFVGKGLRYIYRLEK